MTGLQMVTVTAWVPEPLCLSANLKLIFPTLSRVSSGRVPPVTWLSERLTESGPRLVLNNEISDQTAILGPTVIMRVIVLSIL